MKDLFIPLLNSIQIEMQKIDIENCQISVEESVEMVMFLKKCLAELRTSFLSLESISTQDEVIFFKEVKPKVLGFLLYFNKIHTLELKRPNGSYDTIKDYYENEHRELTTFYDKNLDFYQYYRAGSNYMDEHYFTRGKFSYDLCVESFHFIIDSDFSTGYDYKVAKIICNEMLRIYHNKKINSLEKQSIIDKNRTLLPVGNMKWTASKAAAIELGYALHTSSVINRGQTDIKDIMTFIETFFNIDLGDYYRTYITLKSRKKDRTPFLKSLIDGLIKRMDDDDRNG
jgi:hypothetical protein